VNKTEKNRNVRSFKDLHVWDKAHQLALAVYRATKTFPKEETYGLTSQMRRASVSMAANIVEGSKRHTRRDFTHFLNIAQGSNEELKYFVMLGKDLGYFSEEIKFGLEQQADSLGAMLFSFSEKLK